MISTKIKDLTGMKFTELTVIKFSHVDKFGNSNWLCQCSCGKKKTIPRSRLTKEQTRSCGCKKRQFHFEKTHGKISGKKFGLIKVLEYSHSDKNGPKYFVRCDCGKQKTMYRRNIFRSKSCGCSGKTSDDIVKLSIFNDYKWKARDRDLSFSLTKKQFYKLIDSNCHYCNNSPSNLKTQRGRTYKYNGIDRKDSKKGYNKLNCVSCCGICNRAKHTMKYSEYINWINKINRRR